MAKKITDLTSLPTPDPTDVLVVVDVSTNTTKKTTVAGLMQAGEVVQTVSTNSASVATGTTTLPSDNTIPQNTEGNEYLTQSITPKSATNTLIIEVNVLVSHTASAGDLTVALFQDSGVNAIAATEQTYPAATYVQNISLSFTMTAGTVSSTTFRIRVGSNAAGTTTFNGQSGTVRFGAVPKSHIKITEHKA